MGDPPRTARNLAIGLIGILMPLCPACRCWPGREAVHPKYSEGMEAFLAGRRAAAAMALREFVAVAPGDSRVAEAHYVLGLIALAGGQVHEAESEFRKCLRCRPSRQLEAAARVGLARCALERGAYLECRAACVEMLADEPRTARADEVFYLLAEASRGAGREGEARQVLRRLIEEFPSSPYAERARRKLGMAPSIPEVNPGGRYSVQVAAFAVEANAARHAALLRERGYPASVVARASGGRTLHAVRIGPYATKAEAQVLASRLRREGFEAIVVGN